MNLNKTPPKFKQTVQVKYAIRWEVYQRLQQLEFSCQCKINQPLTVELNTAAEAIQLWSVVRQSTEPRHRLINWLERCFSLQTSY